MFGEYLVECECCYDVNVRREKCYLCLKFWFEFYFVNEMIMENVVEILGKFYI